MNTQNRRSRLCAIALCLSAPVCSLVCFAATATTSQLFAAHPAQTVPSPLPQAETVTVDLAAPSHPLPHFWEQMFGSGRAILTLRESYRNDLRDVKRITDFRYVRFHAILDDEVDIYDEDANGNPVYNFSYIDQIYDGLLANGVRPFVELSFMPSKLASAQTLQSFFYKPIVAPPKSWDKWGDLMAHFAQHLIDRYGIDEVSQWYFEVWNEPNLDFWAGDPKDETYFHLYDVAAQALKAVSPRLRVGGPATAQAAWVDQFLRHCMENHIPVDFVSTHVYANDTSKDVFKVDADIPRDQMVCRAVRKVHDEIVQSQRTDVPLIWSEFNASYKNEVDVTDSLYMGPWLADTIRQCDGLVNMMSYWTFSDVFEEQGVVKQPFYGAYGLIAAGGLPKPAFNAFALLHKLGDQRIDNSSSSALLTRTQNGEVVMALWNLSPPDDTTTSKTITIALSAKFPYKHASIYRLDSEHGSLFPKYASMGKPIYPTQQQIAQLREAANIPAPENRPISGRDFRVELPSHGLALIEFH